MAQLVFRLSRLAARKSGVRARPCRAGPPKPRPGAGHGPARQSPAAGRKKNVGANCEPTRRSGTAKTWSAQLTSLRHSTRRVSYALAQSRIRASVHLTTRDRRFRQRVSRSQNHRWNRPQLGSSRTRCGCAMALHGHRPPGRSRPGVSYKPAPLLNEALSPDYKSAGHAVNFDSTAGNDRYCSMWPGFTLDAPRGHGLCSADKDYSDEDCY